jgi:diguanylate cyclase (GGDEF)-like protein
MSPGAKLKTKSNDALTGGNVASPGQAAPLPANEPERLEALLRYEILDTDSERHFDDLTLLASHICQTPIALVSLVDKDRQWFKARIGLSVAETPRDFSFCAHAILQPNLFIVRDATEDTRFADNPLVTSEPKIRFYAGMPLFTSDSKHALGTLCVIDRVPRELNASQKESLAALARQVQALLELRLRLQQEKHLARIDSLTGAANRRAFYEALEGELSRLKRYGRPFSVAYLDLDNLKRVNDDWGHEAGDAVLCMVSATVRNILRRTDTIGRMGGDEFAILLSEADSDTARAATDKFSHHLLDAMRQNLWPITFSIGLVTCLKAAASVEELLKKADELMYLVKKSGKNNITHATVS